MLVGLDVRDDPPRWRHLDRKPVTAHERELVLLSATPAELQDALDHLMRMIEYRRARAADIDRLEELVGLCAARLPKGASMRDIAAAMPEAERAEYLQIMDQFALDGRLM